jgi:homoserine dehydrogenase
VNTNAEKSRGKRAARVALLGCGTVGREVAARLIELAPAGIELVGVLVRDVERDRGVPASLVTGNADEIFDRRPDVVVELIGGVGIAEVLVRRALGAGIDVVTANKTLIARRGGDLLRLAERCSAHLAYEASVCAGVPVLAALEALAGDRVLRIQGIVNGTCNTILTRMESGATFAEALAEAQQLGFAEADPSADISGRDSAEKLCILAAAAGIAPLGAIDPGQVDCRGIEEITPADLAEARGSRRRIRLVAEVDGESGVLRVGPALLGRDHPLAEVGGARNGIVARAALAGDLFFAGPGAGPRETASAVIGDVARLAGKLLRPGTGGAVVRTAPRHFVRTRAERIAAGAVLATLRRHGATPSEVTLGRDRASAMVHLDEPSARACARVLGGGAGEVLVMPLL